MPCTIYISMRHCVTETIVESLCGKNARKNSLFLSFVLLGSKVFIDITIKSSKISE